MNLVVSMPALAKAAVQMDMRDLLGFMERIRDLPSQEQIEEIRRWIEEPIRANDDAVWP